MELPPPPTPYVPPPERWFDRHTHTDDPTRTLTAMWLMLNDRLGQKATSRRFTPVDNTMLFRMIDKHGSNLMLVWADACNGASGRATETFTKLLSDTRTL